MKSMIILKRFLFVLVLSVVSAMVYAQGGPGDPGGDPGGGAAVPVDGGLSFLLGAGVVYGMKKAYNSKNNKLNSKDETES